jgi:hypothetical protein
MLVTLGSNSSVSAGQSQTFQYACNSAQKIFVRCNDDGADALNGHLTIQIGNDVIVNDIDFSALAKISLLQGGGNSDGADSYFCVNIGSHVLEPLENLYVTIRNAGGASMTAIDVSAIVNEGGVYAPLKWTNYSDNVFTDTNTLSVYAWADASLEDDTSAFTIRNQAYSATPQVQSGVNVSITKVQGGYGEAKKIASLADNQVPLDTSVNYSSSTIVGVVCISAMAKYPSKASASKKAGQAVLSSMTSSERKAL